MLFRPLLRDEPIVKRTADKTELPVWRQPDGQPVSCVEKIKVLNENLTELQQMAQDALEDALLMGCDERQVRDVLQRLMSALENPYRKAEPRE
jgi:hypothetical protein